MTEKELRRLKRAELLEILFYLKKENEELKETLRRQEEAQISVLPADFTEQLRQMIRETVTGVSAQNPAEQSEGEA